MAKGKKQKQAAKPPRGQGGGLKALAENPLIADVVAAALVATASALRDSKRARALASDAGDELGKLSKAGTEAGSALWDMALQIGRRSLEAIQGDGAARKKPKSAAAKKDKAAAGAKKPKKKAAKAGSGKGAS